MKIKALLIPVITLVLLSCKKDRATTPPPEKDKEFIVELNGSYLDKKKIDSASVVWELNGKKQVVKLQLRENVLYASLNSFDEGAGKLSLNLFSNIKFQNQYKSTWIHSGNFNLSHNESAKFSGPASFSDLQWSPRVTLEDAAGHSAIVALRPDDPYFMIKNVPEEVLDVKVGRAYWKTNGGPVMVGGGEWTCYGGCLQNRNRNIENSETFKYLPAQIGDKSWNHIELTVVYTYDKWGGGYILSLNHDI